VRRLWLFSIALLLAAGCAPESDNPLGSGLDDRPGQEVHTLIIEPGPGWVDTGYHGYGNTDGALTLAVGRVGDTLVRCLVDFSLEDLPDEVTASSLYRARVEYYYAQSPGIANWRPFSQGSLAVGVYAVTSEWLAGRATWLERTADEEWEEPGADYTGPFSSFLLDEAPRDYGEIRSFDVTDLVRWWLANPESEFGLLLAALDEGAARVVKEFYSDDIENSANRPHLVVVWESSTGTKKEHRLEAHQDVYIAHDLSQPDSAVYGSSPELPLSAAFGTGGRLAFNFDLSLLPPEATVNLAELELYADFPGRDAARAVAVHPLDEEGLTETRSQGALRRLALSDARVSGGLEPVPPGYVKVNLTAVIQDWIAGLTEQRGLVLKLSDERGYADPVALRTQEAGEGRRPRLVIKYTLPPDFWYNEEPSQNNLTSE